MKKSILIMAVFTLGVLSSCENTPFPELSPTNYEDFVDNQDKFPAFSPDGSRIAYYHLDTPQDPDYPTGLYIIDRDGANRQLVLEGHHFDPDWSPDGKWLVFSSGGIIQKCTIDGDSLQTRDSSTNDFYFSPSYHPYEGYIITDRLVNKDGSLILIQSDFSQTPKTIYDNLTTARSPDFSREGSEILYMKGSQEWPFWEIFLYHISSDREIRLTNNNEDDKDPTWSPLGQQIAWSSTVRIFTMDANGNNQQYLHYGNRPSWSVNDEIVFSFANEEMSREVLYTIRPDGSQLTQITF